MKKKSQNTQTENINKGETEPAAVPAPEENPKEKKARKHVKRHPIIGLIAGIVVLALIVGALGTALVLTDHQLAKLTAQMTYMQDTLSVLNSNVGNMETNIEATLEEQNSLLESCSVALTDIDFKSSAYSVRVDIVPKEYTDTTLCSVYFGTTEVALELQGIYYTGTATLPINESYEQNLTVVFTDGERRTTEIVSSYKGIDIENVDYVNVAQGFTPLYEDGCLTGKGSAEITVYGQDIFSFDSVLYQVCLNGEVAYEMDVLRGTAENLMVQTATGEEGANGEDDADLSDLTNENPDLQNSLPEGESVEDEADADPSEDSDPAWDDASLSEESTEAESVPEEIDPISIISGNYDLDFEIPVEQESTVSIVLRATTKEGYEIVYEIYNGTVVTRMTDGEKKLELMESSAPRSVTFYDLKGGSFTKEIPEQ